LTLAVVVLLRVLVLVLVRVSVVVLRAELTASRRNASGRRLQKGCSEAQADRDEELGVHLVEGSEGRVLGGRVLRRRQVVE